MRALLLAAVVLVGCGSSSKPVYSFPGCGAGADAPGGNCDFGTSETFQCAQQKLADKYDACAVDDDCAIFDASSVTCATSGAAELCQTAVRADSAGAYRDDVANEAQRFCDAQTPSDTPCALGQLGCGEGGPQVAFCDRDAGRCALELNPDAGTIPF